MNNFVMLLCNLLNISNFDLFQLIGTSYSGINILMGRSGHASHSMFVPKTHKNYLYENKN